MIAYDPQSWHEFVRWRGSVLPSAFLYAMPTSLLAVALKILDNEEIVKISEWKLLSNTAAWSAFTGTVGFLLVFRAGQCYGRFERCSTSVFKMRAEMHEAASSLFAFLVMSKADKKDIAGFKDKLIHLFSMLHGCCLASVAGSSHNHFKMIDIDHMPTRFIHALQKANPKHRVDLAYQWINNIVVKEIPTGLLNIPPPILSRFFQEMESAMVEYNEIVQLMTIPFPFPYSQACLILMFIFMGATPLLTVAWTEQAAAAGVLTFLSAVCFLSLEMISSELDNPFGDDANDLPITQIHDEFNESLQVLLHPSMSDELVLKKHKRATLTSQDTWHELDDHQAGDDNNDYQVQISWEMASQGTMDDEVVVQSTELGKEQQRKRSKEPPKSPEQSEPLGTQDDTRAKAPPASLVQDCHDKFQAYHQFAPSKQERSPPQLPPPAPVPWMTQFTQNQRKFEQDILQRLDDIVGALTKPGDMPKQKQKESSV